MSQNPASFDAGKWDKVRAEARAEHREGSPYNEPLGGLASRTRRLLGY